MIIYLTLAGFLAAYWLMGEFFATYRRAVLREDQEDARKPGAVHRDHHGLLWFSAADWIYFIVAVLLTASWTDGWRLRVCVLLSPVAYANAVRFCSRLALLYRDRRSTLLEQRESAARHTLTAEALLTEINSLQKLCLLLLALLTLMPLWHLSLWNLDHLPLEVSLYGFFAYCVFPTLLPVAVVAPTLLRLSRESRQTA